MTAPRPSPSYEAKHHEASLGFCTRFVLKLLLLGSLISIVPLIFVNLPLMVSVMDLAPRLIFVCLFFLNLIAIVLSFALAAKLIFSWGLKGATFSIVKEG